MNGLSNGTAAIDEKDKDIDDNLQPSTSRAGLVDMPKWNLSTRQLYEDNLKSTGMAPHKGLFHHHMPRERVPSVAESTSSDDSCVYMYKGDNESRNGNDVNKSTDCSSPEMDYLEMDFDPCQSNGQESSDGSYSCENAELEKYDNVNEIVYDTCEDVATTSINFGGKYPTTSSWIDGINHESLEPIPSTSNYQKHEIHENGVTKTKNTVVENNSHANSNESDDKVEGAPELSQKTVLIKHIAEATGGSCCMSSILQAVHKLYSMEGLVTEEEIINKILANHQDESNMSIVDYLYSISKGGITIPEMMNVMNKLFDGLITTRFFLTQPRRKVNLSSWLLYWLKKDVVPILSMNFHLTEDDCGSTVNTSWHFQIVHGVGQKGIHLFSQFDCVSEETILKLLNNSSEVLISRDEVMSRWTPESDLTQLMTPPDHSWKKFNVLGQIVNVIREGITGKSEDEMKHIKIPSPHRTGILLLIRSDNPHRRELVEASDLPLFEDFSEATSSDIKPLEAHILKNSGSSIGISKLEHKLNKSQIRSFFKEIN
ncbi:uncharacterized protein [Halyomorpha halys]|uniref:uncharacterized protein isoform X2 n=1 Tax=Halyomorpha halys TaxID=286706 RepID=UPI0006D4FCF9